MLGWRNLCKSPLNEEKTQKNIKDKAEEKLGKGVNDCLGVLSLFRE